MINIIKKNRHKQRIVSFQLPLLAEIDWNFPTTHVDERESTKRTGSRCTITWTTGAEAHHVGCTRRWTALDLCLCSRSRRLCLAQDAQATSTRSFSWTWSVHRPTIFWRAEGANEFFFSFFFSRRLRLKYRVSIASAEGASENFRVFCRTTAYCWVFPLNKIIVTSVTTRAWEFPLA